MGITSESARDCRTGEVHADQQGRNTQARGHLAPVASADRSVLRGEGDLDHMPPRLRRRVHTRAKAIVPRARLHGRRVG